MSKCYKLRILVCKDCGEEFVFTVQAQKYWDSRKLEGAPYRCKPCHKLFKKTHQPDNCNSSPSEVVAMAISSEEE